MEETVSHNITPKRFYSLDVLRGVAALGVVFWHWQHFFYQGTLVVKYKKMLQPFYALFWPVYERGFLAVPLFYSLSGFIFYWLYTQKIEERRVSAKQFGILRFSRLYPLHLALLLLVLFVQLLASKLTGSYIIYAMNDFYHFILNLFFVSGWGFERGSSYNGPVWSVSIEVLLYIVFFVVAYLKGGRLLPVAVFLVISGYLVRKYLSVNIGDGLFSFYVGGASYLIYKKLLKLNIKKILVFAWGLLFLFWLMALVELRYECSLFFIKQTSGIFFLHKIIEWTFSAQALKGIVFPLTILVLALSETYRGTLGKRFRFIGDMSYSSYLIHFPLEIGFILIASYFGISKNLFYHREVLILYFVILLFLSFLSYHFFEKRVQQYLRKRLLVEKKSQGDKE